MDIETALAFAAEHPAFAGHFPGAPIVPGVLLLDEAVHAAQHGGMAVTGVASAKFLRPVGPDQALVLACAAEGARVNFNITQAGQPVAAGQLLAADGP